MGPDNKQFLEDFLANFVQPPLIQDDTIVFGILMAILGLVFYTSSLKKGFWAKFYVIFPSLFVCYFAPAILATFNVVSSDYSNIYSIAKYYLLPASLLLMTLSIDLKGIINLGPKSLIMFITATIGVVFGGPIAVWIFSSFSSDVIIGGMENDATWRGLSTLAGSWIGGGANQTAMYELFNYKEELYGSMITVDIVVANIWMAVLLYGIGKTKKIDKWLKADSSAVDNLINRMSDFEKKVSRTPTLTDYMMILGVAFAGVSLSHFLGKLFSEFFTDYYVSSTGKSVESVQNLYILASHFFWLIVISTLIGFILSLTKARNLEGAGASKFGSIFIYILVVTIGMKMDITKTFSNPGLFLVGLTWMAIHVGLLIIVAKIIRAPYFFLAVGSKANIGGAASAPVVAGAFHPSLSTVGVLLAVMGYFLGTYGAWACAEMMRLVSM